MTIKYNTSIKKTTRSLLRECPYNRETPEKLVNRLFSELVGEVLGKRNKNGTSARAEETVAELIRSGLRKDDVEPRFAYLGVALEHATYYLYRTEPGKGSVEVHWKGFQCSVKPALQAKELAQAIRELDAMFPELEVRMKEFLERVAVERKAAEIQRIAVGAQLEAVLPDMGLGCTFNVKDDKVHLDLTRTFQGSVDLPLAELQAFLADPERIHDTLQPDKHGYVHDIDHYFLGRPPVARFP